MMIPKLLSRRPTTLLKIYLFAVWNSLATSMRHLSSTSIPTLKQGLPSLIVYLTKKLAMMLTVFKEPKLLNKLQKVSIKQGLSKCKRWHRLHLTRSFYGSMSVKELIAMLYTTVLRLFIMKICQLSFLKLSTFTVL